MTKKFQNSMPIIILIVSLLIFMTIFFDVMQNNDGDAIMTGLTATFGGTPYQVGTYFSHTVNFSILNLLAFTLPAVLSIVFAVLSINHKKTSPYKLLFGILLTLVFGLSIYLIFQLPQNTTYITTILGAQVNGHYGGTNLAIGGILAYILGMIGAILSLVYTVLQFEK